jgi:hypothetical protein
MPPLRNSIYFATPLLWRFLLFLVPKRIKRLAEIMNQFTRPANLDDKHPEGRLLPTQGQILSGVQKKACAALPDDSLHTLNIDRTLD